jgi:hypothetical protein
MGATTLSITTFSKVTLSINGLFVTLSINDTQRDKIVVMLSVAFYILLCCMILCRGAIQWHFKLQYFLNLKGQFKKHALPLGSLRIVVMQCLSQWHTV